MAAWAAPPHLRRWRRRGRLLGGANATITVRSNLLGGSGWVGYSSTDGSGGGGDGLIVMDGKVNVTATGATVGGDATGSMGGLTRLRARSAGPGQPWPDHGRQCCQQQRLPQPISLRHLGAGVVAKDNVYIVNYGTITAGRRFRRQRRRGQADRRWQSPGTGERIQHHGPYPVDRPQHAGAEQPGWQAHHRLHDGRPVPGARRHLRGPRHPTAADRLDVNGKAQIHGTVSVVAGTGTRKARATPS